ncbi:MAG: DUF501 domain-containing protein [Firmicutes bacterium]|nr:DUF501 domain-containing protein [Bacillota bacterium]
MHKRCGYGYPQVIVTRPVSATYSNLEVFPTLYWLTCPYLCKELALLEAEGLIAHFEERIQTDPEFADQVEKNHEQYATRRLSLIPTVVRENIKEEYPERYRVLAETGVGGIRSLEGVKCLHTHVADYLAHGENPIGAETVKILAKPLDCPTKQCEDEESL